MSDQKGQLSLDLLIAVLIFTLTTVAVMYYIVSSFTPYSSESLYLQASAYRVAMILAEDAGLNVTNITGNGSTKYVNISTNWEVALNDGNITFVKQGNVTRIGLANAAPIKSSYEVCLPCCLNKTKVEVFFNKTKWKEVWGNAYLTNLSNLLGLNILMRYKHSKFIKMNISYNISLRYMNGTVVRLGNEVCQIGEPIPTTGNIVKFERLVVIYNGGVYHAKDIKRLVIYVW